MRPVAPRGIWTTEFWITGAGIVAVGLATQPQQVMDLLSLLPPQWRAAATSLLGIATTIAAVWYKTRSQNRKALPPAGSGGT
jgi:hypothetical protein